MRVLGNSPKTKDLNAASVSFEPRDTSRLESFFIGALIAPPLDELASLLLLFSYVWRYTVGIAILKFRQEARDHREAKFLEGLKETHDDYISKNRELRRERAAERKHEREAAAKEPGAGAAVDTKDLGLRDATKHVLTQAMLKPAHDRLDTDRPELVDDEVLVDLLDSAVRDLRQTGLNQVAQDRLFLGKRLADLPVNAAKTVLIILEDNLSSEDVIVEDRVITLSSRGVAAVAAIRRVVLESNGVSPEDDETDLEQILTTNQRFSKKTVKDIKEALDAAFEVDVASMEAEAGRAADLESPTVEFVR